MSIAPRLTAKVPVSPKTAPNTTDLNLRNHPLLASFRSRATSGSGTRRPLRAMGSFRQTPCPANRNPEKFGNLSPLRKSAGGSFYQPRHPANGNHQKSTNLSPGRRPVQPTVS